MMPPEEVCYIQEVCPLYNNPRVKRKTHLARKSVPCQSIYYGDCEMYLQLIVWVDNEQPACSIAKGKEIRERLERNNTEAVESGSPKDAGKEHIDEFY